MIGVAGSNIMGSIDGHLLGLKTPKRRGSRLRASLLFQGRRTSAGWFTPRVLLTPVSLAYRQACCQ